MSNIAILEQAKKEAKRLLKIARSKNSENPQILIHNLSEAKEIVARLQGYPNWRTFENSKSKEPETHINLNTFKDVISNEHVEEDEVKGFLKFTDFSDDDDDIEENGLLLNSGETHEFKDSKEFLDFQQKSIFQENLPLQYRRKKDTIYPQIRKVKADWKIGEVIKDGWIPFGKQKENYIFDESTLRTHILISGSSGKNSRMVTESLSKIQIAKASPLLHMVGTYDEKILYNLWDQSKKTGNEDGFRILYLYPVDPSHKKEISSIDPFEDMSVNSLVEILLPEPTSDNGMWRGRALAMLTGIIDAAIELQKKDDLILDVPTLRFLLTQDGMSYLHTHRKVSEDAKKRIISYIRSIPGTKAEGDTFSFNKEAEGQHGFLTMQITRALRMLEYGYEDGYFSTTPTDSILDVFQNNLSMIVFMDGIAGKSYQNLFYQKLLIYKIREVFSLFISRKLAQNSNLKMIVFDEFSQEENNLEHISVVASQARAFGTSLIFSGKNNWFDQPSIFANTNTKIAFKDEDLSVGTKFARFAQDFSDPTGFLKRPEENLHSLNTGECYSFQKGIIQKVKIDYEPMVPALMKLQDREPRYEIVEK